MPVKYNIISPRDAKQQNQERFDTKIDKRQSFKAVIVDALGNQSGSGDIWADQATRRLWVMKLGSTAPQQVLCVRIPRPVIGLGVVCGYIDHLSNTLEVLRTDYEFYQPSNTLGNSWEAPDFIDFLPGGQQQLWIASKMITPLATIPDDTGLIVSIVAGDYPYQGERKTFEGQTGKDLSTSQPSAGEYRFVGLYLDSSNTLQTVNGTAGASPIPAEPTWPAGAFRLSVVRLYNPQTKINFLRDNDSDNDIFDRRMAWSDDNSFRNIWPGPGKLKIGNTEYSTVAAAIAAAVSGDEIYGEGTYTCDAETLPAGVSLIGSARIGLVLQTTSGQQVLTLGGSNYLANLTLINTGNSASELRALRINTDASTGFNCRFVVSNAGAGDTAAVKYDSGATHTNYLWNCRFEYSAAGGGTGRGLFASSASACVMYAHWCYFASAGQAIGISLSPIIYADYSVIAAGSISAPAGSLRGVFSDFGGATPGPLKIRAAETLSEWYETAAPAVSASTNHWLLYFQSDGIYIKDDAGNATNLLASGIWLHDISLALRRFFSTLTAALAAAEDGDAIKHEAGTSTGTFTIADQISLLGQGIDKTVITNTAATSDEVITVSDTNVNISDLTVSQSGAGGGGVGHACIKNNQAGLVLDNVWLTKTTGSSTTATGFWQIAGDALLRNCKINVTAASVVNYAILLGTAGSTCIVEGGEIAAGVITTTHASAVIKLQGPKLGSGVTFDNSGGGTISGFYYDSNGIFRWINTSGVLPVKVKNTSGATAAVGEVGYITYTASSGPEYKTTTTANDINYSTACVVMVGAANNSDIYVATEGEVTLLYDGSDPAAGDFLFFGTTAGKLTKSTDMRAELVAIAKAAGSGGAVLATLFTGTKFVPYTSNTRLFSCLNHSSGLFIATINGAPTATSVVYNAPSSGNENVITPEAAGQLAKMLLHNTTRGTSRKIDSNNTGTNTITTVSSTDAWATTDTITIESQTVTTALADKAIDLDLSSQSEIPILARAIKILIQQEDSGAAGGGLALLHPHETFNGNKQTGIVRTQAANVINSISDDVKLINRRFDIRESASGTGTSDTYLSIEGYYLATP